MDEAENEKEMKATFLVFLIKIIKSHLPSFSLFVKTARWRRNYLQEKTLLHSFFTAANAYAG